MRYVLAVSSLLLFACAAPPAEEDGEAPPPTAGQEEATPAQQPEAVRQAIEGRNADLVRWFAAGAADSVATLFAEDSHEFLLNGEPLVGRDAIREFWTESLGWGRWEFELETQDVAVSGPMAVERGSFALTFTAGPDAPPEMASFEDRGNYLVHWRRDADDVWRIVVHAPVSEMPIRTPPNE